MDFLAAQPPRAIDRKRMVGDLSLLRRFQPQNGHSGGDQRGFRRIRGVAAQCWWPGTEPIIRHCLPRAHRP